MDLTHGWCRALHNPLLRNTARREMTKPYVHPGEPLNDFLRSFWQRQVDAAEQETPDYRHPPLPLARIKKVMKSDPDVKVCVCFGRAFWEHLY